MEVPLTVECPHCGAEMEPTRRGRTVYACPECGHEMEADVAERDVERDDEN